MCDPVSAMIGLTIAQGVLGAKAQNDAGKYNQQIAEQNARYREWQAKDAERRGDLEEAAFRRKAEGEIGARRSLIGASGAELDSGSPLTILEDAAWLAEIDAATIRSNTAREAYDYRVGATNARAEGRLARYQGKTGAMGTLLGTAASAFGMSAAYGGGSPARSGGTTRTAPSGQVRGYTGGRFGGGV